MRQAVLVAFALFVVVAVGTTVAARLAPNAQAPHVTSSLMPVTPGGTASPPSTTPGAGATSASAPAPASSTPVAPSLTTPTAAPPAPSPEGLTYADVARHATLADCWIVVDGRVYDVTNYLRTHPGGIDTISPWCGKESTVAYETEDGAGTHSSRADRLLESYYVADLRR